MIGKRPKTKDLVLPKNYELISEDEARNIIGGAKVGFRIHISPDIRALGAIVGSTAAATAVAAATWRLAAFGPIGAGAAAGLPTLAAGLVGYAIEHKWDYWDVVVPALGRIDIIIPIRI